MKRISDYGIIGDCRSAALVSRDGSIDWLCWPRFDSDSIFGALLDDAAGRFRIAPTTPFRTERWYLSDTNVLQTRFVTEAGSLLMTDLMPVVSEADKRRQLVPEHEILRIVECERGQIEVVTEFEPRPGFARAACRWRAIGQFGLRVERGCEVLTLRCDRPLALPADGRAVFRTQLRAGERLQYSLCYAGEWPAVLPPLGRRTYDAIERSIAWWREWAAGLHYAGPHRDAVVRSALALRLLFYAPSGAVIAAPTTSLPERLGGDLNWDYRFCWLRDAALTVRALFGLGCVGEAEAFVTWLLHTTRLTQPELRVLYDVYGNRPLQERVLERLDGFRGSRPVRIGNAATGQFQLDVYGEVIDAATHFTHHGGTFDPDTERMLAAFGEYVCRHWDQPDEGIWEPRSGRAHNTHSRVLCWTALDRLLELHDNGLLRTGPIDKFRENRELIRRDVHDRAWNPELQSYVAHLDGDRLDASLLLMPWYGFEDPRSSRMRKTYACIRERLGAGDVLLYRNREPDLEGEGTFGICSFWGVEYLALGGGSVEQACAAFERMCGYANDLGLFAEEIDPTTGEALGNFPQAFTHVGLINAALTLTDRLGGERLEARTSDADIDRAVGDRP